MTEFWRKKDNQMVAAAGPGWEGGGGHGRLMPCVSNYHDNVNNLRELVSLIQQNNNQAKFIFSISPIPLARTVTRHGAVVANCEAKSILRATVSEICNFSPNVFYFPSYEICINHSSAFSI